jgi:hypothetical protein
MTTRRRIFMRYTAGVRWRSIDTLGVLWGTLPRRAQALVLEWAVLHRAELRENWGRARQGMALRQIEPLE